MSAFFVLKGVKHGNMVRFRIDGLFKVEVGMKRFAIAYQIKHKEGEVMPHVVLNWGHWEDWEYDMDYKGIEIRGMLFNRQFRKLIGRSTPEENVTPKRR